MLKKSPRPPARTAAPNPIAPSRRLPSTTANLPEVFRPKSLSEVVGHKDVVTAFTTWQAENTWPRAMLFTGPTGVGKSTFAYLVCRLVNGGKDVHEVNAGSQGGVAKMRELLDLSKRKTLTGVPRIIIIDEAHALTAEAINALLVPTERGPSDTIWVFSTNEPHKLPATLKRRFRVFALNAVSIVDLKKLLKRASAVLSLEVTDARLEAFAVSAHGSPSLALTALERWRDAGCPKKLNVGAHEAAVDPSDTQTILAFKALNALLTKDAKEFLASLLKITSDASFLFVAHVVLKGYIEANYLPVDVKPHGLYFAFKRGATTKPNSWFCLTLLSSILELEAKGVQNKESIYCALLPLLSDANSEG